MGVEAGPSSSGRASQASSWRNPTVGTYLAKLQTGSRSLVQMARQGRSGPPPPHAHSDEDPGGADDEERALLIGQPSSAAPAAAEPGVLARWQTMVALAALSVLICYADRSNISTAIIPMAEQYGWDSGQQGVVLSAFFAGYLATQLLGGTLADRYGGKGVLAFGVTAWSLCTCLTPAAAAAGLPALLGMRVAMGLGEGVAFPAIHSLISRRVPVPRQSTAVGLVTAASYAGTALAFGLAPRIIEQLGWPWVFYAFGISAVLWLPFWLPLPRGEDPPAGGGSLSSSRASREARLLQRMPSSPARGALSCPASPHAAQLGTIAEEQEEEPSKAAGISAFVPSAGGGLGAVGSDRDDAVSDAGTDWSDGVAAGWRGAQGAQAGAGGTGLLALARTKPVWAICVAQYTGSWGFYGLLNWLPSFFSDHYHVQMADLGSFTLGPYLVQGCVGATAGLLADKLLARGWPVKRVRRVLQTCGMLGPAACMLAAASPLTDGSPTAASAWVTLGLGLNALTLAGVSVSHLDIAPRNAGAVFAAGNTAATLAGLLAVPVTGLVLSATDSWALVFGITAVHYVIGAALFALWVGDEPLPQDGSAALQ